MNQNEFEQHIPGARVLSDDELIHTRGGGILGDAWDAVKGAAGAVGDAVATGAHAVVSAVEWIIDHVHLPKEWPIPNPKPFPTPWPKGPGRI